MLDSIRSGAQSFGVKLAFGIIILVFVFWGVGNFNDRDYSNVVAVVNGEPIVAMEFEKAYQNAEEYILRNNPGMTREKLIQDHLGRQVLRGLINETLLAQEAARAGVTVSPMELRQAAGKIKAFQDDNGRFDPEAYKRALAARRMTAPQYEKELGDELLREKMFALITSPTWVDPDEALHLFNFLREQRVVDYFFVAARDFLGKARVTDQEIRAWYDTHGTDYTIPPKTDVAYIAITPEALGKPDTIAESRARDWYEAHKQNYATKERIHAAHILIPLPQDADEPAVAEARSKIAGAKSRIDAGKSFAAVADEVNGEGAADKGGDLGWISRGEAVPEFEEAAFALEPGKISDVIRTPFGLHLVQVLEKQAAGIKPFEEVKDEALKTLAFEDGSERLHDVLDNLIEDNILGKPLAESAARYGLKEERTGLVDKQELEKKLGVKPDSASAIMATEAGAPLDTAFEAGDKYLVARVLESKPATIKPFEDVRDQIEKTLKGDKALALAMDDANRLLKKYENQSFNTVKAENSQILESKPLDRTGQLADFVQDPALAEAIFEAPQGHWLPKAYAVSDPSGQGALIARVAKIILPEASEFAGVEEILQNSAKRDRMEAVYALFMQSLIDKAKIEVTNQNLVDRAGR